MLQFVPMCCKIIAVQSDYRVSLTGPKVKFHVRGNVPGMCRIVDNFLYAAGNMQEILHYPAHILEQKSGGNLTFVPVTCLFVQHVCFMCLVCALEVNE